MGDIFQASKKGPYKWAGHRCGTGRGVEEGHGLGNRYCRPHARWAVGGMSRGENNQTYFVGSRGSFTDVRPITGSARDLAFRKSLVQTETRQEGPLCVSV